MNNFQWLPTKCYQSRVHVNCFLYLYRLFAGVLSSSPPVVCEPVCTALTKYWDIINLIMGTRG